MNAMRIVAIDTDYRGDGNTSNNSGRTHITWISDYVISSPDDRTVPLTIAKYTGTDSFSFASVTYTTLQEDISTIDGNKKATTTGGMSGVYTTVHTFGVPALDSTSHFHAILTFGEELSTGYRIVGVRGASTTYAPYTISNLKINGVTPASNIGNSTSSVMLYSYAEAAHIGDTVEIEADITVPNSVASRTRELRFTPMRAAGTGTTGSYAICSAANAGSRLSQVRREYDLTKPVSGHSYSEWATSNIRSFLNNAFLSQLPTLVQNGIVNAKKTYCHVIPDGLGQVIPVLSASTTAQPNVAVLPSGQSNYVSSDALWIPSRVETNAGGTGYGSVASQDHVNYSSIFYNSSTRKRTALKSTDGCPWWLREDYNSSNTTISVRYSDSNYTVYAPTYFKSQAVSSTGAFMTQTVNENTGIVFGFCT